MPNPVASNLPNPTSYDSSQPEVVIDNVTGVMWETNPTASILSPTDAQNHCAELRTGDHCDWRLPSRIELVSLVDFTRAPTALDPSFPETTGDFLTSSVFMDYRWRIGADGGTRIVSKTLSDQGRTRCVRRGTKRPVREHRYMFGCESAQGTATDLATGLIWQRRPSTEGYTFADAQTYCSTLELGGGGLRVPSKKELQTVLDEQAPKFTDPEVFPDFLRHKT